MTKIINPALAGSMKTLKLAQAITTGQYEQIQLSSNRSLYVAPSIDLGIQFSNWVKGFLPNLPIHIINSDTVSAVQIAVHQHLTNADSNSQLVIITKDAFKLVSEKDVQGWNVFMDEVPPLFESVTINLSSSHTASQFDEIFVFNSQTHQVTLNSLQARTASTDGLNMNLREVIQMLKSGRYNAFMKEMPEEGKKYVLQIIPSEHFCIGDTFVLLGANCDKHPITNGYDYKIENKGNANHNSDKIIIHYMMDTTNNSKWFREHYSELFIQMNIIALEHAETVKNEHNTLYVSNKETPFTINQEWVTSLPWLAIGSNEWIDSNTIILLSTQNIDSDTHEFLVSKCGLTADQLDWERKSTPAYQRVMRTCIRKNGILTEEVHVYVASLQDAINLIEYFPNAQLDKLGDIVEPTRTNVGGRPTGSVKEIKMTGTQRNKLSAFKKKYVDNPTQFDKATQLKINTALSYKGLKAYNLLEEMGAFTMKPIVVIEEMVTEEDLRKATFVKIKHAEAAYPNTINLVIHEFGHDKPLLVQKLKHFGIWNQLTAQGRYRRKI